MTNCIAKACHCHDFHKGDIVNIYDADETKIVYKSAKVVDVHHTISGAPQLTLEAVGFISVDAERAEVTKRLAASEITPSNNHSQQPTKNKTASPIPK